MRAAQPEVFLRCKFMLTFLILIKIYYFGAPIVYNVRHRFSGFLNPYNVEASFNHFSNLSEGINVTQPRPQFSNCFFDYLLDS